ncbi:hypothetical protein BKP45_03640 [Anaerobacillus alkalidiazotrophicus]|uniref:Phosphotyrosine protein phosphatase I domain-containing protein n=1 Tax=Anaerobacillus alkalidiazotrophicus TaxID=472963 RepID=A0A1S2MAR8_9BACI|nr:low molecular weight protein arginine phosphatase [Anaerobacillus alkalidiazotrophicus]OIJ21801.1 hypothetical protein BKP45_03640 [Anaerobacillus alkalidiazotrophicus]
MERFLFVCTGNTCRSPLAEALLKHKRPDLQVKSAGVSALPGMNVSEGSLNVLGEKGIPFEHLSNQVNEQLMKWADIVLTLTVSHKRLLVKQFPFFVDKIFTLKEYAFKEDVDKIQSLLQHHYAELEIKQAKFLGENKEKIEELNKANDDESKSQLNALTQNLQQLLNEDRKAIEEAEKQILNLDISDPFGGSFEIYRNTAKEIEEAIDHMLKKI